MDFAGGGSEGGREGGRQAGREGVREGGSHSIKTNCILSNSAKLFNILPGEKREREREREREGDKAKFNQI